MEFLQRWIGVILILAGLARAGVVVLQEPVVGYANDGDMHRTSACTGLFPAAQPASREPTPDAPIALYALGSRTDGCYLSSEVGIAATAVAIARAVGVDPGRIKLQYVGYVKLALLFATAFVLAWLLRDHAAASAVHGLIVLLVLGDPVVALWMNTLYTEFAAIWAIYAVVGGATVLALYDRVSLLAWAILLVGLLVLAFAREQYALLPLAMALAAWPWLWHVSERLTVVTMALVVVATAVSLWTIPRDVEVQKRNRANAYLGVLLPASSSPARGAAIVGLPADCAALSGETWARQRADIEKRCPQVFTLSRFAFLGFAADEPEALYRAAARSLAQVHGVAPPKLGVLAGERGKTVDDLPPWGFTPLRLLDSQLPGPVVAAFTVSVFALAPLALLALVVMRRWRGDPLAPLLVAMLLGGTAIYSYATAVFGGGAPEGRPDAVGSLAGYVLLIGAIAGVPVVALRWKHTPREALLEGTLGAIAIAVIAFACFALVS